MRSSLSRHPEYSTWSGMKQRCANPNAVGWSNYGGRGISVCDRWRDSFQNFIADMGPKPGPKYSIDRIDNDGNYEPGNCRWATAAQQASNKRRCRHSSWSFGLTLSEATAEKMMLFRRSNKITCKAMSDAIGASALSISLWERRVIAPTAREAEAVSAFTGISPESMRPVLTIEGHDAHGVRPVRIRCRLVALWIEAESGRHLASGIFRFCEGKSKHKLRRLADFPHPTRICINRYRWGNDPAGQFWADDFPRSLPPHLNGGK